MTITRRGLHAEISRIEKEIDASNKDKAGMYAAYREQLAADHSKSEVKDELDDFKKAHRKARALDENADAVMDKDARVDAIVDELRKTGTDNAPRASRTRGTESRGGGESRPVRVTRSEAGMRPEPGSTSVTCASDVDGIARQRLAGVAPGPRDTIPDPEPDARGATQASSEPASPVVRFDGDAGSLPIHDGIPAFLDRGPKAVAS